MFKWKRKHEGNKFEYTLVLEDDDDDDEVLGSVVVTEDIGNGDITVKAECEEIGYKAIEEHVDMNCIKTTVSNMKKFIKEELEKIETLR
jgi:hypothetical protein